MSLPSASGTSRAASATAEPPLEPPDIRLGAHGLRLEPMSGLTDVIPQANSCVCVLPTRIAPAARARGRPQHRPPERARRTLASRRPYGHPGVEEVLDAERHARERPARPAVRVRSLVRGRLCLRTLETERAEGADQSVDLRRFAPRALHDLDRRHRRGAKPRAAPRAEATARSRLDYRGLLVHAGPPCGRTATGAPSRSRSTSTPRPSGAGRSS